ncbi:MAG: hypothetical protein KatS3mg057_0181 [Herpetosiphonaceae bacterium]|nr:MAG: hypothetical protein KatS3mg057_0181 [Herpetosiphonaceae bacterium]
MDAGSMIENIEAVRRRLAALLQQRPEALSAWDGALKEAVDTLSETAEDLRAILEQVRISDPAPLKQKRSMTRHAEDALYRAMVELELPVQQRTRQLQALSRQLLAVQETERRYLARELHDEIGQGLTGLKLTLEMITPVPEHRPRLEQARSILNELLGQVRDLSLDLRPAMLDDLGLLPALLWLFNRYTTRTGIQVDFKHAGLEDRCATEVETSAYRIIQEALTNVARHAAVDAVSVCVLNERRVLSIRVEDQGIGFEPERAFTSGTSSGLAGMRERAALLGGELIIESAPDEGTRLVAILPLGDTASN